MALKYMGAAACCLVLLSGCNTATQVNKLGEVKAAAQQNQMQDEMTLSGRAEPYQEVLVSSKMEGKIKTMAAELGAYVKQGDQLAELDEGELPALVKQAEDQIKVVEAQGNLTAMEHQIALNETMASLNQAMVGLNTKLPPETPTMPDSPDLSGYPALEAAKTAVADAKFALNEVNKEWLTTKELYDNGLVSKQEMDQATSAKNKAQIELDRAEQLVKTETAKADIQKQYEKEKKVYSQEKKKYEQERKKYEREQAKLDQEAKRAAQQTDKSAKDTMKLQQQSAEVNSQMTQIAIEEAKAKLQAIKDQYKNLPVVAPVDGFITEKNGRIGEMASPGSPLFVITNLDQLYITIDVPEAMINRWKENQSVEVLIPTQNLTTKGKVVYIGLLPNKSEQTYPVKVLIDNRDHKIKGGMKAVVTWKGEAKKP